MQVASQVRVLGAASPIPYFPASKTSEMFLLLSYPMAIPLSTHLRGFGFLILLKIYVPKILGWLESIVIAQDTKGM